jgi:PAS domain-containing protein
MKWWIGRKELIISCGFLVFGVCWILFTDRLLLYYSAHLSTTTIHRIQSVKGVSFIVLVAVYILFVLRSYTARIKSYLQRLQSTSAELQSMITGYTDGFFVLKDDLVIATAKGSFKNLLPPKSLPVEGRSLTDVFPGIKTEDFYKYYRAATADNNPRHFEQYSTSLKKWLRFIVYPYQKGVSVSFKDITGEKERANRIAEKERNLVTLINSTTDLVWSVNKEFCYYTFNSAYEKQYELHFKERLYIGKTALQTKMGEEHYLKWKALYTRAFNGETFSEEMDFEMEHQTRRALVNFNPVYHGNTIIGAGCFLRDITEACSHQRVIEQQNKRLREIAYITSHSLRAPLANILGLASILDTHDFANPMNASIIDHLVISAEHLDTRIKEIVQQTTSE